MVAPLLDAAVPMQTGPRADRPSILPTRHADKCYQYRRCRDACVPRGLPHRIAPKGIESTTRLGRHRWRVERTFAWTACYRRLVVRYERLVAMPLLLWLACASIRSARLRFQHNQVPISTTAAGGRVPLLASQRGMDHSPNSA